MQGSIPFCLAAPGAAAPAGLPMILFDFDGTLVDSMPLTIRELEETFKTVGLPVPPRALLEKGNGPSHEEAAGLLGVPGHLHEMFNRVRGEFQMALLEACQQIYPGIPQMLETLRSCALLCVVSNGRQVYIDRSMAFWHLDGYFAKAQGGRPGFTKGQLIGEMIREYRPSRAMMVGDRLSDIAAGRENGLYTIAAAYGFSYPEEWREADAIAGSVEELTDLCLRFCLG